MLNLTQYFIPGPQGTLSLKAGTNFSYKGDHLQVHTNTEIDRWFVGAFTSANYFITVEFDSNQKESLQVMVVARPDHASFTVYGRTSVDDQLITVTAEVTNSWLSLKASPANAAYAGARISLFATYSETMLPLKRPTVVGSFAPGGGGSGGTALPPLVGGTTGSGVSVQVSDTAPSVTETGSLWFNSNTGELFVYYKDGTSDQWVQPASAGGVSGGSGSYILPLAGVGSGGALGGVKVDGTSITINGSGVISGSSSYTLPIASASVLGGVKVDGTSITVDGAGVISGVASYTLPTASQTILGGVKVDSSSITITNGTIAVPAVATIGQANGVATLGSDGKLAATQIPSSLTGAVVFKGTWNASTNTPTLLNGDGTAGWEFVVSTSGTRNLGVGNVTYNVGDYVIYNGSIWDRIPASTIASAGTLIGTTLNSTVVTSSLTSVGTLANLTVTNTITGSITGNASTVTNGVVTTGTYSDPSWLALTKSKVGLGNVDNTSDAGKPVSTATQTALDLKAPKADPIFTGTVTLGAVGNVSITGGTTGQVLTTNGSGTLSWTTVSGGATNLDSLSDVTVSSAASGQMLVYTGSNFVNYTSRLFHQFAYPATTALDVTNNGASAYLFNNQYSGNNPTIFVISGATIAFNLNVTGHPFLIQTSSGTNYNTGLIHVAVDGTVSTGSNAQGKVTGTLYWQISADVNGDYRYICSIHSNMVGVITVNNARLASRGTAAGTTASLANNATGNLTIVGFKGYVLYKIQTSAGAWVRVYTDGTSRTADSSRLQTSDPTPGSGVIAEVITSGAQTIVVAPGTIGFNNESSPTTNIELAVTNLSGGTTTITVTLTILKIEA
jgi:plastocyanin